MLLLLHKTLKGSRNIQGFALIRVVLLHFRVSMKSIFCIEYEMHEESDLKI